jgi:AraC family transcriptional regulator of adaptative response/methylated-DNA-[protein]-cysteine methyltransferase
MTMPSDYARIEKALGYIAGNAAAQPDLEAMARAAGLSSFHFQRLFTRWVGLSPKKFLQFLTLEHAKSALADTASILDASFDSGLSGAGRLHDLFVTHEAVTPGEFKRRGEGLEIVWGWADSPFGDALVMVTERGICGLAFASERGRAATFDDMRARWPQARLAADDRRVATTARRIFAPRRRGDEPLHLVLHGSPFQVKVWEALLRIPVGGLASYETVTRLATGAARGARAVGAAVGGNPVSFLIPCHRVIRKTGAFSDYHWGRARKLALIGWEAANDGAASRAA